MSTISHAEMVTRLAKPGEEILKSLTWQKVHVWHMASCLMGEAGEVASADSEADFLEEFGDLEFYAQGLRSGLNIDLSQVPACMIEEHMVLYPIDGLTIATCDIFDACKKWIIYEKEIDIIKVLEGLARYEFYMNLLREENNFTREDVLKANMDKLAKRYGSDYSYTNAAAQKRADKQT